MRLRAKGTTQKPQNGSLGQLKTDAVHKRGLKRHRVLQNTEGDTLHWTVADLASTIQASVMQLQIAGTYTRKAAAAEREAQPLQPDGGLLPIVDQDGDDHKSVFRCTFRETQTSNKQRNLIWLPGCIYFFLWELI